MMAAQRSWRALFCMLWVLLGAVLSSAAQAKPEFYLVTYGPGTEVWERFGHNALWLRDRVTGEDRLFNYGFFDFQQKGFFKNFLLGRMLYFAAATEPSDEFAFYQRYNRTITYQRLNLSDEQAQHLAQLLKRSVQPEHREYLYDYFLDNCSTRVRDAIDEALGQHLVQQSDALPADTTFRESALTLVQDDFLLYLGIQRVWGVTPISPFLRGSISTCPFSSVSSYKMSQMVTNPWWGPPKPITKAMWRRLS